MLILRGALLTILFFLGSLSLHALEKVVARRVAPHPCSTRSHQLEWSLVLPQPSTYNAWHIAGA